jgi:hypothetical protein
VIYRFHVHARHPAYRLVTREDVGFPAGARPEDWTFTRARAAADSNLDVVRLVDETGYCLFKIGMRLDEVED